MLFLHGNRRLKINITTTRNQNEKKKDKKLCPEKHRNMLGDKSYEAGRQSYNGGQDTKTAN